MKQLFPESWVLLEISSIEQGKIRKIFAGWYGGYCGSDEWKLSSGNLPEYTENEYIVFPQESGALYYCHPKSQGMSGFMAQKLAYFRSKLPEGAAIEIIEYK